MAVDSSSRNRLLLALPSRNVKRLMPKLKQIRCHRAQVLHLVKSRSEWSDYCKLGKEPADIPNIHS
jgi:hypothetical protein